MSQNALLDAFDALAARQPDELARALDEEGIPAAAQSHAQSDLALALTAIRTAISRWHPRPALTSPADYAGALHALEEIVTAQCAVVVASYGERVRQVFRDTTGRLVAWQRERFAKLDKPSPADIDALSEPTDYIDYDHFELVDLGAGQYTIRYNLKTRREKE